MQIKSKAGKTGELFWVSRIEVADLPVLTTALLQLLVIVIQ